MALVSVILIPMTPRETLEAFDRYLSGRRLRLEAVVIGGAALNLLGIISRATKDCDILDPPLPSAIIEAARSFAAESRRHGDALQDDWLNNGPASLASCPGSSTRTVTPTGLHMRGRRWPI